MRKRRQNGANMVEQKKRLGDILMDHEMITESDLKKALNHGRKNGLRLGEALIDMGRVTEEKILWTLAEQLGISFIRITEDQISEKTVKLVPEDMARRHLALPLFRVGDELTLAINDPLQEEFLSNVEKLTGLKIDLGLAKSEDILEALDKVYGRETADKEGSGIKMESPRYGKEEIAKILSDKTASTLLDLVISDCLSEGINHVHLDIREGRARLRMRESGLLHTVLLMDAGWGKALISRLAVLGGRPRQDEKSGSWRVGLDIEGKAVGLDVSWLSTETGEAASIRILGKRAAKMAFGKLGLTPVQKASVEAMLARHGMIVVTGPADSGRATTVATLLDRFDPEERLVITAEDWARTEKKDYLQIKPDSLPADRPGMDIIASLDPDVLYMETLEREDMDRALRLGMSGAFVFTLLGFSRTVSALSYLSGLDVHPALLAEGLSGIIAQNLLPRLCDKCKVELEKTPELLSPIPEQYRDGLEKATLYEAKGCPACNGTGYSGRVAVFEVLLMDERLRDAVSSGVSVAGLPVDFGKPAGDLPGRVLDKISRGQVEYRHILAMR